MTPNLHATRDPARVWLTTQLRWEDTLERLRLRHATTVRRRRTQARTAA